MEAIKVIHVYWSLEETNYFLQVPFRKSEKYLEKHLTCGEKSNHKSPQTPFLSNSRKRG